MPSESDPDPFNVVLFVGRIKVLVEPAFAIGGALAAKTVTETSSLAVALLLSVTVNLKT